ncbi:cytochrome c [Swingsia samuiensis]|uniref:C-type cytochrome n=1 Tax=Swingsia samuiensis TaxID=1293412 RepID=A0A4Y6UGD6_9PROT|nr:cytochrome c [Swingsia samuiensis]QDH16613.1 c-type cytochrome [Swingsia samuiensis]
MLKRIITFVFGISILSFGVLAGVIFLAYAWHPAIAPISRPDPHSFSEDTIKHGKIIATEGFCAECHTRKDLNGGPVFAGDYRMETPFGAIYSSNLTPDPDTGIGKWSLAAFRRAMHDGIARDGSQLYPAFPFDHFTKMSDKDVADLYAYFMSIPAVHQKPRNNTVPFPLNVRLISQAGWKLLFFTPQRYQYDPKHDKKWNRGAYLAESISHCGACHTPRNLLGAEKLNHQYAGGSVDGWDAPPLNQHNPTPTPWTEKELFAYLRTGVAPLHGSAAGPMSDIPHHYLSQAPKEDVEALAYYFASLDQSAQRDGNEDAMIKRAMNMSGQDLTGPQTHDPDARLFQSACGACHYNSGPQPVLGRPELALNSALWLDDPTNLFQVMLNGISAGEGQKDVAMPSFYAALSNHDMARIASYLRRTRTTLPPWNNLEQTAARIRASLPAPPINASH